MMPLSRRSAPRAGFTLVELMVVVVLLSLVVGAMVRVVVRQQRFYRGASDIIDTRSQLRQAVNVLPADLRGISRRGSGLAGTDPDILAMRDSMIDVRVLVGTGTACAASASAANPGSITVLPADLAKGNSLTALPDLPKRGDFVFVFRDGDPLKSSDDQWTRYQLTADATTSTAVCTAGPLVQAADAAKPRVSVAIAGSIGFDIPAGTPVRFARRTRYSLYRAADTRWYLGYNTWNGSAWNGIQPVSGPYRPYSTLADSTGLRFAYYDSLGAVTTVPGNVARIDIVVRGETESAIKIPGFKDGRYRDSLVMRVAVRNRN